LSYHRQERRLVTAQNAWRKALQITPARRDVAFAAATLQLTLDRAHPEAVEQEYGPVLDGLADRILRADILNNLGEAYGRSGLIDESRARFAESLDVFHLPKKLNYRAQKGLGGL
jgi:hypothetical protein